MQPTLTSYIIRHIPQLAPQYVTSLPAALIKPAITNKQIQTYVRPDYVYVSDDQFDAQKQWQAVVLSGAGQQRFNDKHVLTQLLLEYCPVIHSLELPMHGNNRHQISTFDMSKPTAEALRLALAMLTPLLRHKRRTLFVGYSLGSLTLLKLYTQLEQLVTGGDTSRQAKRQCALLLIATSLAPPPKPNCDSIHHYWTQAVHTDQMGKLMVQQHGRETCDVLFKWIAEVNGRTDSDYWPTQSEREPLLNDPDRRLFIVNGELDTFSIHECILPYVSDQWVQQRRLFRVPGCTHIDYFQKQKSWPAVSRCVRAVMVDGVKEIKRLSPTQQQQSTPIRWLYDVLPSCESCSE